MYEVRRAELRQEGRYHVAEEDNTFGDVGADEVEGCGEDDDVEDIVDEPWVLSAMVQVVGYCSSFILETQDPDRRLT